MMVPCKTKPLLLLQILTFPSLNKYTSKQPGSWFTVPRQRSLLEKYLTTGAATGDRTRVSRLHVQRADHYTIAAEWLQIQFRLVRNPQEDWGSDTCFGDDSFCKATELLTIEHEQRPRDNVCNRWTDGGGSFCLIEPWTAYYNAWTEALSPHKQRQWYVMIVPTRPNPFFFLRIQDFASLNKYTLSNQVAGSQLPAKGAC